MWRRRPGGTASGTGERGERRGEEGERRQPASHRKALNPPPARARTHASRSSPTSPTHAPPAHLSPSTPHSSIADAVALFHAAVFTYQATVWAWHWSPAAAALPGARGFGRFFRYLTFYSYTLQTAAFGLSAASAALPLAPRARVGLCRAADDAACAVFGLANVVTVLYYSLEAATAAVVEGGPVARPPWLGRSVHLWNAVAAWTDLLVAHPRSFSPRAARLSHAAAGTYTAWLLVVRVASGTFPYPILNALPMPAGYVGLTATALALFAGLFALGRRLSTPLVRVKAKAGWPQAAGGEW